MPIQIKPAYETASPDDGYRVLIDRLWPRGGSREGPRSTTGSRSWAYKFGLLEAGVRLRRRAWQEREVVLDPEAWPVVADSGESPHSQAETGELMKMLKQGVDGGLTEHQREVLVALALNGVPIDVLAERLNTTRGAHQRRPIMDKPTNDTILNRLLGPADHEVLCDECFEKLDEYVDLQIKGAPADERVPGMRAHLEGCPGAKRNTPACVRWSSRTQPAARNW